MTALVAEGRLLGLVSERLRKVQAPLNIRLWNGALIEAAPGRVPITMAVHSPKALTHLVNPSLGQLARSYVEGDLDFDAPMREVVQAGEVLADPSGGHYGPTKRWLPWRHTRQEDRRNIQAHYDVGNDFYGLWLDRHRVYSCGYFKSPDDSIDQAQEQKLDHICSKLMLKPGDRLLDIGCGWGGLILWAARNYQVRALGITLSEGQYRYAQEKIRELGLEDRCEVRLLDYRDVPENEPFDKISSVGMFEHVGLKNLPMYFAKIYRLLKPGGLLLNHGITTASLEGVGRGLGEFVQDYVFPGGELMHVSTVTREMGRQGMEVLDAECLRPHYARTLWHWVERLEARRVEARAMVGEKTLRVWLVYMAGSAHAFARGWISLYQLLGARPLADGTLAYPLTRDHMYR